MNMNDTLINILSRKSVRQYTDQPVSLDTLHVLVKAGMSAPSAVDKRPWDFIIIDTRSLLDTLADSLPYASMARKAPAGIVVAGNLKEQHDGEQSDYWICDCSAATQNILIAAESLGLGAVWTAVYPDTKRISTVRTLLSIPEHCIPLSFIPVGYPEGKDKIKDKYDETRIHYNNWQD